MTSILIVDDHPVVRRGLRQTLREEFRDTVFGEAGDAKKALLAVTKQPWDIVILDITMPDRDGFEVLDEIRRQRPEIKVLVLGAHSEPRYAARARQLGACGYISMDASLSELVKAVWKALAGKEYCSRASSDQVTSRPTSLQRAGKPLHATLSDREHEVLLAVAAGKGVGEIAAELSLSVKTVSTYKRRVLNKLQLNSTADLVRYFVTHKLS
jgi:DNA-binding NarL/FixJ family response regulator